MLQLNQQYKQSFHISSALYVGFIHLFNDRNPMHVDDEFAKKKGFHRKIMQGNILNGFISYFIGECLPIKNIVIHSQEIQFKKPFYLNDTLHLNATISDIFESVNVVEFKFDFQNLEPNIIAKGKIRIGVLA